MIAWIPGRKNVASINKDTVIKASASDFGFKPNNSIILSYINTTSNSYRIGYLKIKNCAAISLEANTVGFGT